MIKPAIFVSEKITTVKNKLFGRSVITRADGSGGGEVFTFVCLSAISNTIPQRSINKLDVEMFLHEFWNQGCRGI